MKTYKPGKLGRKIIEYFAKNPNSCIGATDACVIADEEDYQKFRSGCRGNYNASVKGYGIMNTLTKAGITVQVWERPRAWMINSDVVFVL
jgi:hypothetical protein